MFQPPRMHVNLMRQNISRPQLKSSQSVRVDSTTPTCQVTLRENLRQYLLNTTLHGLKYVGNNTITPFDRIFFGLMFLVVVLLSGYFITNVYMKYSARPMLISLNPVSTDITSLPFPGVTLCNMNQAVKGVVRTMPTNSEDYSMVQSLCATAIDENVTNSVAGKWAAFQRLLVNVSQSCEEMLIYCQYGGMEFNCTDMFVTVLTDEGLCCTFNAVNKKYMTKSKFRSEQEFNISSLLEDFANDWTPETGFANEYLRQNKYGSPRPVIGPGTHLGLTLLLDGGISEYYCSSTNSYGYKILLHSPNEGARISNFGVQVINGYESRVVITPIISEATYSIRKLPVKVRQCYFENESFLTYYRTYSRENCFMECLAKIYLSFCKCILYYLPRFHDDIIICGRSDDKCTNSVTRRIKARTNSTFVCDCLPGCFEIIYDAQVSMAPLLQNSAIMQKTKIPCQNVTALHIFYKNNYFRSQKKDEIIGFTEFLSTTGGLIGLFMGFSFFSIAEIFYFLTMRPYSNHVKVTKKRNQKIKRMIKRVKNMHTRRLVTPVLYSHAKNKEMLEQSSTTPSIYPA